LNRKVMIDSSSDETSPDNGYPSGMSTSLPSLSNWN